MSQEPVTSDFNALDNIPAIDDDEQSKRASLNLIKKK
jgi:hypothetical protein